MKLRYLLLLTSILLTPFSQTANSQPLDGVYAIVNDDVITQQEFEQAKSAVVSQLNSSRTPLPSTTILDRQILERLILERLQLQVAQRRGIQVSEEQLDQAISGIATRNKMTVQQLQRRLLEQKRSYTQFRRGIRKKLMIQDLLNLVIRNKLQVTTEEIDDFLTKERQRGDLNLEYDLSLISISIAADASAEQIQQALNKAEKALKALQDGEKFSSVSAQFSDASNALEGGHLGWLPAGQLPLLFTRALRRMQAGDISYLIRAANGFHILKLFARRGGRSQLVNQTHLRSILMTPDKLLTAKEMMTRLRQIRQRILNGEKFADLAVAYSKDNRTRLKGGDLGWLTPGEMVPEVEAVIKDMKEGEISLPIRTSYGAHIIQVLARRRTDAGDKLNENKAREQIFSRKFDARYNDWVRNLRSSAFIKVLRPDV